MNPETVQPVKQDRPDAGKEVFRPIHLKEFFVPHPVEKSVQALILVERQSLKVCDRPLADGEVDKVKALLRRAISEGRITLEEYKQWRAKWGLYDFDDMTEFHILILAGELKNLFSGWKFNALPF